MSLTEAELPVELLEAFVSITCRAVNCCFAILLEGNKSIASAVQTAFLAILLPKLYLILDGASGAFLFDLLDIQESLPQKVKLSEKSSSLLSAINVAVVNFAALRAKYPHGKTSSCNFASTALKSMMESFVPWYFKTRYFISVYAGNIYDVFKLFPWNNSFLFRTSYEKGFVVLTFFEKYRQFREPSHPVGTLIEGQPNIFSQYLLLVNYFLASFSLLDTCVRPLVASHSKLLFPELASNQKLETIFQSDYFSKFVSSLGIISSYLPLSKYPVAFKYKNALLNAIYLSYFDDARRILRREFELVKVHVQLYHPNLVSATNSSIQKGMLAYSSILAGYGTSRCSIVELPLYALELSEACKAIAATMDACLPGLKESIGCSLVSSEADAFESRNHPLPGSTFLSIYQASAFLNSVRITLKELAPFAYSQNALLVNRCKFPGSDVFCRIRSSLIYFFISLRKRLALKEASISELCLLSDYFKKNLHLKLFYYYLEVDLLAFPKFNVVESAIQAFRAYAQSNKALISYSFYHCMGRCWLTMLPCLLDFQTYYIDNSFSTKSAMIKKLSLVTYDCPPIFKRELLCQAFEVFLCNSCREFMHSELFWTSDETAAFTQELMDFVTTKLDAEPSNKNDTFTLKKLYVTLPNAVHLFIDHLLSCISRGSLAVLVSSSRVAEMKDQANKCFARFKGSHFEPSFFLAIWNRFINYCKLAFTRKCTEFVNDLKKIPLPPRTTREYWQEICTIASTGSKSSWPSLGEIGARLGLLRRPRTKKTEKSLSINFRRLQEFYVLIFSDPLSGEIPSTTIKSRFDAHDFNLILQVRAKAKLMVEMKRYMLAIQEITRDSTLMAMAKEDLGSYSLAELQFIIENFRNVLSALKN